MRRREKNKVVFAVEGAQCFYNSSVSTAGDALFVMYGSTVLMLCLIALICHIKLVHNRATQIFLACSNIMRQQIFFINTLTFLFHVYDYHSLKGNYPLFFPFSFCPLLCLLRSLIVLYLPSSTGSLLIFHF
jgi:hypothetical protein